MCARTHTYKMLTRKRELIWGKYSYYNTKVYNTYYRMVYKKCRKMFAP